MAQIVSSQVDVQKPVQYYAEGLLSTATNFAKAIPTSTSFTTIGKNAKFTYSDEITKEDLRKAGSINRNDSVLTGKQGTLQITTNVTDDDLDFIKYCFNDGDGTTATIDSSLAFVYSYNVAGTETYRILKGCLPTSASLNVTNRGLVELQATFTVFSPEDETQSSDGGLTTPSFGTVTTGTVWSHSSGGSSPFTWDSVTYRERGFNLGVSYEYTTLDSSGETTIQWAKITKKEVTGSASIFKKDLLLQADVTAHNRVTASRVIKTSQATVTFTNAVFDGHSYNADGDTSDATIEEMGFTADSVAIA
jgi:hypothetical protein